MSKTNCVFRSINKNKLNLDTKYQRDAVSKRKISDIASKFDWNLFKTLLVAERKDKTLWVVDGGNRYRACMIKKEITNVPCFMFKSKGLKHEAEVFLNSNIYTTNVSALDKHRAALIMGDPVALECEDIVVFNGYNTAKSEAKYSFQAIGMLRKLVEKDIDIARFSFEVSAKLAKGKSIPYYIIEGIFTLVNRFSGSIELFTESKPFLNIYKYEISEIDRKMHARSAIEEGKRGGTVGARAIIELINKGSRKKLNWFDGGEG